MITANATILPALIPPAGQYEPPIALSIGVPPALRHFPGTTGSVDQSRQTDPSTSYNTTTVLNSPLPFNAFATITGTSSGSGVVLPTVPDVAFVYLLKAEVNLVAFSLTFS